MIILTSNLTVDCVVPSFHMRRILTRILSFSFIPSLLLLFLLTFRVDSFNYKLPQKFSSNSIKKSNHYNITTELYSLPLKMSSTAIDPMKRDNKRLAMSDNFKAFRTAIVYLLVVLPIWLVVLLPITLASLLIEGAVGLVTGVGKKKSETKAKSDDGPEYGTFEEIANVTPTKAREFDLVLYGATGEIQLRLL